MSSSSQLLRGWKQGPTVHCSRCLNFAPSGMCIFNTSKYNIRQCQHCSEQSRKKLQLWSPLAQRNIAVNMSFLVNRTLRKRFHLGYPHNTSSALWAILTPTYHLKTSALNDLSYGFSSVIIQQSPWKIAECVFFTGLNGILSQK